MLLVAACVGTVRADSVGSSAINTRRVLLSALVILLTASMRIAGKSINRYFARRDFLVPICLILDMFYTSVEAYLAYLFRCMRIDTDVFGPCSGRRRWVGMVLDVCPLRAS